MDRLPVRHHDGPARKGRDIDGPTHRSFARLESSTGPFGPDQRSFKKDGNFSNTLLAEPAAPRACALDNTPSDSDAELLLRYPRVGWINGLGVRSPFSECQLQQPLLNFDRPPIVPHERFTRPLIRDPIGRLSKHRRSVYTNINCRTRKHKSENPPVCNNTSAHAN